MFNKKDTDFKDGFDTLLGESTLFKGNIESEGTVRIDGKLIGDVKANGDVFIGTNALITGNVTAANISMSGTVEGNIISMGILKILSKAKLYGDVQVKSFMVDEGAVFLGKCNMSQSGVPEEVAVKTPSRKSSRDYKKSDILEQVYDESSNNSKE